MTGVSLIRHCDLDHFGNDSALRKALDKGEVVRVRHGVYIDAETWARAWPEERARLRAHAYDTATDRSAVYGFLTAGALWRLPLYRMTDPRVHTIEPGPRPATSRSGVFRHHGPLPDSDITEIDGMRVTSLSRTVFDLVRTSTLEAAVSAFDAALRLVAWNAGTYDVEADAQLRADVQQRIDRAAGARGIRRARFVVEFADGRAQLPGESVSRLWMQQLGVRTPELQVRVRLPDGSHAYTDFAWPDLRLFGEFDGDAKYLDPALTAGRSARDVLRDQRAREAGVIAATGWSPVRWGNERLDTLATFEAFLRSQHLL